MGGAGGNADVTITTNEEDFQMSDTKLTAQQAEIVRDQELLLNALPGDRDLDLRDIIDALIRLGWAQEEETTAREEQLEIPV
jgi:hypothetical protein